MKALAQHLADAFCALHAAGVRERDTFSQLLRAALEANPAALSVWTVWEPEALDGRDAQFADAEGHDHTGRFLPCWHRAAGAPALIPTTGYEAPGEGDWYWVPKRQLSACYLDPIDYRFGALVVSITSHIVPLIMEGRFHGAVGVDQRAPDSPIRHAGGKLSSRQRASTTPVADARLVGLSPREREVLHWLALGKSNEEIATILAISPHTVKNHLDHIFQKLGVHNRFEAARLAP